MGRRDGEKVVDGGDRQDGFLGLGWPEKAPWAWSLGFAVSFVLLYELHRLMEPVVAVVDARVSLIFLPAFVRVVAVLVAGFAGALGIFAGALFLGVVNGDGLWVATAQAAISASSPCLAVVLLQFAIRRSTRLFDLWTLLLVAGLTSLFSALLHGAFWAEFEPTALSVGAHTVSLMMFGDLLGIFLGFLLLRLGVALVRVIRLQTRVWRG
jgi:hypothetical protein